MKTSDDAFDNTPPQAREIPDYESDPFRLVANHEEALLDNYSLNLQGHTVKTNQTPLAVALAEAGVTHTRHAYFDLPEWLDNKLDHEQFRANVTSSLAWFCDTTVINLARAMFFRDYKESEKDDTMSMQENYDAFINGFMGTVDFNESGSEFSDGITRDLTMMLGFSEKMHDLAERCAGAIGRDYLPKSFGELLTTEKPAPVRPETKAKLMQIAKFVVEDEQGGKAELEKHEAETLEMLIARTEAQAVRSHEARKRINPIIEGLLEVAKRYKKDDVEFYHLDRQLQERLVRQAEAAAVRALSQLASYNSIEPVEFAMIMRNVRDIKKELNSVLETFRTPEEDATIRAQQRQAKVIKAEALAKAKAAATPEERNEAEATAALAQEEIDALEARKNDPTLAVTAIQVETAKE